ncbi:MAG: efflux RND transporter periplasmic adaptor subunit [Xanthomonadales bacterium]|nr:efflux RND transporter periplasmic adaptor subunit [Xanthomonadales bacterium]
MAKRTIIFIVILLLVLSVPAFIKYRQIQVAMASMGGGGMPPTSVEAAEVRHAMWQDRVAAVGTLTARDGIDVKNEVEGVIETIHVGSGQRVESGDLLVSINDDVEQADMAALQAQVALAKLNFERSRVMWENKTGSEREYDDARSALQVAQANLAQVRARIAKKNIRAPFDGLLGIRMVNKGQYVSPGTTLFSLQDHGVLYTDFSIPESYFPVINPGLEVQFKVSAYPGRVFTGKVEAIEAKVNEMTRNINVRASLENEKSLLLPGMYADIYLVLAQPTERLVVPSTSIVFSSFGDSLFVVKPGEGGQQVAQQVQVAIGEQRGDLAEVLSGLAGDEMVVQAGTNKLRNNAPVSISEQPRLKN